MGSGRTRLNCALLGGDPTARPAGTIRPACAVHETPKQFLPDLSSTSAKAATVISCQGLFRHPQGSLWPHELGPLESSAMNTAPTAPAGQGCDSANVPPQNSDVVPRADQPPPAPPPAATTVLNGQRSERETQLESELQSTRGTVKERELRINQLEDENRRLKAVPAAAVPTAAPAPASAGKRKRTGFAWTLLENDDDD